MVSVFRSYCNLKLFSNKGVELCHAKDMASKEARVRNYIQLVNIQREAMRDAQHSLRRCEEIRKVAEQHLRDLTVEYGDSIHDALWEAGADFLCDGEVPIEGEIDFVDADEVVAEILREPVWYTIDGRDGVWVKAGTHCRTFRMQEVTTGAIVFAFQSQLKVVN